MSKVEGGGLIDTPPPPSRLRVTIFSSREASRVSISELGHLSLWRVLCTSFNTLYCVRSSVGSQPTSSTSFSEQNLFKTKLASNASQTVQHLAYRCCACTTLFSNLFNLLLYYYYG